MEWFIKSSQISKRDSFSANSQCGRQKLHFLALFYIILPACLALHSGLGASGSQRLSDPNYYIIYWLCSTIPAWISAGIGTAIASLLLRRFGTSLILVLCLGHLTGMNLIWLPLCDLRNELLSGLAAPGQQLQHAWDHSSPYIIAYQVIKGMTFWVLFNYLASLMFNIPRFGYTISFGALKRGFTAVPVQAKRHRDQPCDIAQGTTTEQSEAAEELTKRIAPYGVDAITSMQAEDHYTLVCLNDCKKLIYMPFSKAALGASALNGLQTHRSYWVRVSAIRQVLKQDTKTFAELKTGQLIPVSRHRKTTLNTVLSERHTA